MTASERLMRYSRCIIEDCDEDWECENCWGTKIQIVDDCKRGAELLKKAEQGLLIELPVPLGSICYQVVRSHPCKNKSFIREQEMSMWLMAENEWSISSDGIFATKEEAEKRLAELRGEE